MRRALDIVATHLGREYGLIIGGERLKTDDKIRSINPARPAQIVGIHQKAGAAQAEPAMSAALRAYRILEPDSSRRARLAAARRRRHHPRAQVRIHGLAHL